MVTRISPKKAVPHFLKQWRVKKQLTQQQLADLLPAGADGKATGKDQVSRWERNERGMTMDVQAALAEALGIAPEDLFRDPEAQRKDSIDRMLEEFPPEFADEADLLREELKLRVRSTLDLVERTRRH